MRTVSQMQARFALYCLLISTVLSGEDNEIILDIKPPEGCIVLKFPIPRTGKNRVLKACGIQGELLLDIVPHKFCAYLL